MPSQVVAMVEPAGFQTCSSCGAYALCSVLALYERGERVAQVVRCRDSCMQGTTLRHEVKGSGTGVSSRTRKKARRCEEQTAKETGGRQTAASGSGVAKGDSRTEWWMFEDKFTDNLSFRITKAMVTKAMAQAAKSGRSAVIRIHMKDGFSVGVVPWSDLLPYLEGGNNG